MNAKEAFSAAIRVVGCYAAVGGGASSFKPGSAGWSWASPQIDGRVPVGLPPGRGILPVVIQYWC